MRWMLILLGVTVTLVATGCDSEGGDWAKAKEADTIAGYETFLQKHHAGDHNGDATAKLAALRGEAAWNDARAQGSIAAYRAFLKSYPDSNRAVDVRSLLEPLMFSECMGGRDLQLYDEYLRTFAGGPHVADVEHRREDVRFANALDTAARAGTFEAYRDVVLAHPNQDQLVMFDGGIGGFLERYIKLSELCPEDRPRLEKIASDQGVTMADVTNFPGFKVGPPPTKASDSPASSLNRETRADCYPIAEWSANDMKLFETSGVSMPIPGGRSVRSTTNFGENANKVFTFIGRRVGGRLHIVAAKLKEVLVAR